MRYKKECNCAAAAAAFTEAVRLKITERGKKTKKQNYVNTRETNLMDLK